MRKQLTRFMGIMLAVAGLISMSGGKVAASITPTLDSVTPSGGNFVYNYHADLTSDQSIISGSFVTIYDFSGLVGTPTVDQPGWTVSTALVGKTAAGTAPTDNPTILNFSITWTGGTVAGPVPAIITFHATSTFNQTNILAGNLQFTSQATKTTLPGSPFGSIGPVTGPNSLVPEPTSFVLLALGLPACLFLRRKIRV
jgi:hypothetical protein